VHEHFDKLYPQSNYSTGIHPWYIDAANSNWQLDRMKIASQASNVLAIGECGLDRLCSVDFRLQEKVFIEQIAWANEIAKPLIIHCVKAHREALALLKEHNRTVPVIFHGFNNNEDIASSIIQSRCYLSFGKSLFNPNLEKVFAGIFNERLFLETDDSDHTIESIYAQAARIKNSIL
jgi:TatD DNase family protein